MTDLAVSDFRITGVGCGITAICVEDRHKTVAENGLCDIMHQIDGIAAAAICG